MVLRGKEIAVKFFVAGVFLGGLWVLFSNIFGGIQEPFSVNQPQALSQEAALGKRLFEENCAVCHGKAGSGTDSGPPLIHPIYEPNHHGDGSFYRAAKQGVRAHHWKFGHMPPVKSVSNNEVTKIISYVREIQRANGIF